jgi:hypothetical protein
MRVERFSAKLKEAPFECRCACHSNAVARAIRMPLRVPFECRRACYRNYGAHR